MRVDFRLVPEGARRGNILGQAPGEQLAAQTGQILTPGEILGDGVQPIPGRRFHQLEILLVLRGGPRRDLVEKRARVARVGATELGERPEEMIVPGLALRRHEAAHREGIDQLVIEMLVLGHIGGSDVAGLADRLGLGARLDRLRLGEGLGDRIDAQPILTANADEGLGIDRPVEMIVQVGALRHALEKSIEGERIAPNGIERLCRAKLAVLRLLLCTRKERHRQDCEKHGNG